MEFDFKPRMYSCLTNSFADGLVSISRLYISYKKV